MTMTAVTFAATIDRVLNGLTRPFFGWISDMIGRENTMFIAFGIEGVGIWALYMLGHDPVWFVILSGLVFFAWGEIYSLFPSTCTDTFGAKFATTNAGLLYTAKGTAALLVPIANYMQQSSGQLGQRVHHRRRRQYPGIAACDRRAQAMAQDRWWQRRSLRLQPAIVSAIERPALKGRALFCCLAPGSALPPSRLS